MSSPTDRARRRAGLAPLLSYGSAGIAIVIAAAFFYQAGMFESLVPKEVPVPPKVDNPEQISAKESTVTGLDREQQPYEITAEKALQDKNKPNKVYLDRVTGKFRRTSGEVLNVVANRALYDSDTKLLDLDGDVRITSKDRFTALMQKAQVITKDKALTSSVPVEVDFGSGTVLANGLEITDDGKRILFLNRVKATFKSPAKKGDGKP
jgi:lipopolysaccharide export system protein LptC